MKNLLRVALFATLVLAGRSGVRAQDDLTAQNQTPVQMVCRSVTETWNGGSRQYLVCIHTNDNSHWVCGRSGNRITCTEEGDPAPCPANPAICGYSYSDWTQETVWVPADLWVQNQYSGSAAIKPGAIDNLRQRLPEIVALTPDEIADATVSCDAAFHAAVSVCPHGKRRAAAQQTCASTAARALADCVVARALPLP